MMKDVLRLARAVTAICVLWATPALACEEYLNLGAAELKSLRDKLVEPDADSIDRLFAFQELVCSSNPTMRAYAIREGLKSSADRLVREQIMFDAMMQKGRIEIELSAGPSSTADDKAFIKEHSGIWVQDVAFVSKTEGCLSLYSRNKCSADTRILVRGDKIEFTYGRAIGEFYLTDTNELVGYVRASNTNRFSRIPAVLKLY